MVRAMSAARFLLAVAATTAFAQPTRAGIDTDVLTVTATVLSACSLSGGASLNFGTYTTGQPSNSDVNGTINFVNCSGTLTFALDGGSSGNVNARQMRNGASILNYQLYRNPPRTAIWGLGADAQVHLQLGGQSGSVTVYGRIPGGQVVPEGTYTDTVNVTLTF